MYSISNACSCIAGILAPIVDGYIVVDKGRVDQWRTVFYINSVMLWLAGLAYFIWAKGEIVLALNYVEEKKEEEEDKENEKEVLKE